ncbi:MAG: hypothetical protein AAFR87_17750 [Bacteroidota bacterium]
MGWDVQGYYRNQGGTHPSWHVESSGDSLEEVEAFEGKNPLSEDQEDNLEIYFGNRELVLFRGISNIKDLDKLKDKLRKFEGFLVYADKWNPLKKQFRSNEISFIDLGSRTVFHEQVEGDISLIKRGLTDILERLEGQAPSEGGPMQILNTHILSLSADEKG